MEDLQNAGVTYDHYIAKFYLKRALAGLRNIAATT